MRRFQLVRSEDVSGISGTGIVAEGVQFHDGQVVVSWFGRHHCMSTWFSIKDVESIHGHGGLTVVEWLDKEDDDNWEQCYECDISAASEDLRQVCTSCVED